MRESKIDDVLFLSFGHSPDWDFAKTRLQNSIRKYFPKSKTYFVDQAWFEETRFFKENEKFIRTHPKGCGLWTWKPLLISEALFRFPNVKHIVYLDMGCELNICTKSYKRFYEYLQISNEYGALAFELELDEIDWTSKNVLDFFDAIYSTKKQVSASILFFENNQKSKEFVDKWLEHTTFNRYALITGEISKLNSNSESMHRHDQSILSLMWHKSDFAVIPDETYWGLDWMLGAHIPIWTARNRELVSILSNLNLRKLARIIRLLRNFLKNFLKFNKI